MPYSFSHNTNVRKWQNKARGMLKELGILVVEQPQDSPVPVHFFTRFCVLWSAASETQLTWFAQSSRSQPGIMTRVSKDDLGPLHSSYYSAMEATG